MNQTEEAHHRLPFSLFFKKKKKKKKKSRRVDKRLLSLFFSFFLNLSNKKISKTDRSSSMRLGMDLTEQMPWTSSSKEKNVEMCVLGGSCRDLIIRWERKNDLSSQQLHRDEGRMAHFHLLSCSPSQFLACQVRHQRRRWRRRRERKREREEYFILITIAAVLSLILWNTCFSRRNLG